MIKLTHLTTAFFIITLLMLNACGQKQVSVQEKNSPKDTMMNIDDIAAKYVKLTIKVGQHHSSYIDAYYGPKEWQPTGEPVELDVLKQLTQQLLINIKEVQ